MARGLALNEIHPAVEAGVNDRDLDGLMALYADEARMVTMDGSVAEGRDAIREQWAAILAMDGRMTVESRFAIEMGDLAVLSNTWTFSAGGEKLSATTSEVAQRQPDGSWLYIQ